MKRNLYRILSLVIAVMLCLLLTACGKKEKKEDESSLPSAVPTIEPTVTPAPKMVKVAVIKGADSGLNIRASASTDGEILGLAENGDEFRLMSSNAESGWYQIQYESRNAFVSSDFVDIKEVEESKLDKKDFDNSSDLDETSSSPEDDDVSSEPTSSNSKNLPTKGNEDGEN